jgi:hypothetical protein
LLFSVVHCRRGTTKSAGATKPNLYKHDGITITHDKINFPNAKSNISCDQAEPFLLQKGQRLVFGRLPLTLGQS